LGERVERLAFRPGWEEPCSTSRIKNELALPAAAYAYGESYFSHDGYY
jgi:hypothetical protein